MTAYKRRYDVFSMEPLPLPIHHINVEFRISDFNASYELGKRISEAIEKQILDSYNESYSATTQIRPDQYDNSALDSIGESTQELPAVQDESEGVHTNDTTTGQSINPDHTITVNQDRDSRD